MQVIVLYGWRVPSIRVMCCPFCLLCGVIMYSCARWKGKSISCYESQALFLDEFRVQLKLPMSSTYILHWALLATLQSLVYVSN